MALIKRTEFIHDLKRGPFMPLLEFDHKIAVIGMRPGMGKAPARAQRVAFHFRNGHDVFGNILKHALGPLDGTPGGRQVIMYNGPLIPFRKKTARDLQV